MNRTFSHSRSDSNVWAPGEILKQEAAIKNRWWWHRLTMPPEISGQLTTIQRERARRAQLLSTIVFCLMLVVLLLTPATLFIPNRYVFFLCLFMLGICFVSLLFNRANRVLFASILVVVMLEMALILVIATTLPFDIANLPLYDLLVMALLFAASLLPPSYIFATALVNVLFICGDLYLQRNYPGLATPVLKTYLHTQFYAALARPASLEIIVGVVIYLWVRSTSQALARADRAELIARLEHELASQKKQLETGIQHILQTHAEVANGNLDARAPLTQDHALWPLANALNTLLTRFNRSCKAERELQHIQNLLPQLVNTLQDAEQTQQPVPAFSRTFTSLDPLFSWLSGKWVVSPPPGYSRSRENPH